MDVEYASQLVPGSPFTVSCFDNNAIQVIGVQDGIVGRASSFIGTNFIYFLHNISIKY